MILQEISKNRINIIIDSRLTVYDDVHEVIFTFVSNIE